MKHRITKSNIHYFISENHPAQSETLIFLHPAFANHKAFDSQIMAFEQSYRLITVDILGHGLSQGYKTTDRIDDTTKHIIEILNQEKIHKVHLVGVSIGSLLAQDFCNKHPEYVLSLCAVGGYDINNYDASLEKSQRKQQLSFVIKALFSINAFSASNARVSTYTDAARSQFYEMNCMFKRRSFQYMATLVKIMNQSKQNDKYPLLIVYGEHDNDLAIQLSKSWHMNRKESQLVVIENAGHCANMDNPQVFNTVLSHFLETL